MRRRRREDISFRNLYKWKGFSSFLHIFFNVIFLLSEWIPNEAATPSCLLMWSLKHLAMKSATYHFLLPKTLKYPYRDFGHLPFDHLTSYRRFHESSQQSFVKHFVLCYEYEVIDSWKLFYFILFTEMSFKFCISLVIMPYATSEGLLQVPIRANGTVLLCWRKHVWGKL